MSEKPLIPCPQCSKGISLHVISCPHCGHPVKLYRQFQWKSKAMIGCWPVVHIAFGRDKETGKFLVAKGLIAIGQFAVGIITFAQFGFGFLFGFGQFIFSYSALAQFAVSIYFGIGQFAIGSTAIGQFALGKYVLAQAGFGEFVWSVNRKDPQAVRYFRELWMSVRNYFGIN